MGRLFGWLDRGYVETIEEYDNRMNRLPEIHAGFVFFDWMNYRSYARSFSVFIEWNGELNHKLQDAMPQGGYCFWCTPEEAASLINDHNGIPVYIKLYAKCGRLYVKHLYFKRGDKRCEIHFNGCEVSPPDMVCFVGLQNYSSQQGILPLLDYKEPDKNEEPAKKWWTGSGHAIRGSYPKKRGSYRSLFGSYKGFGGSYKISRGSYRGLGGSYRKLQGSFYGNLLGSYRGMSSSYLSYSGSYRNLWSSYLSYGGSYRNLLGSYRSYGGSYYNFLGSYYGVSGSYRSMFGSYRNLGIGYGSYWGSQGSSYRNVLGSYRGSYRNLSGSYRNLNGHYTRLDGNDNENIYQNMNYEPELHTDDILEEIQVDGALGYGLELI